MCNCSRAIRPPTNQGTTSVNPSWHCAPDPRAYWHVSVQDERPCEDYGVQSMVVCSQLWECR
ncbi:hypothetical protein VFPPC_18028 [Pochonia chlamydosporia 170]|uniref:Uncharacterized protein n=1 Tax=Pochonia chlamydosporia 170 TaxID=1380566 RepID=A0A219APR2_METCM|nr:hypothetical protein VFPPC_18028 [Pochonia chlamydosporia 170]OWT42773.1 hypothetical protein VFPPC_18028 [Pochonia chlamydosporia 170]